MFVCMYSYMHACMHACMYIHVDERACAGVGWSLPGSTGCDPWKNVLGTVSLMTLLLCSQRYVLSCSHMRMTCARCH